jgi:hypothetical protein
MIEILRIMLGLMMIVHFMGIVDAITSPMG